MKGRIVIVGTGAGAEATLDLRKLMGRRARLLGTMLRARPLDEKATAIRAFTREVVPHLATGRIAPLVDRVFPADEASRRSRPAGRAGQARQGAARLRALAARGRSPNDASGHVRRAQTSRASSANSTCSSSIVNGGASATPSRSHRVSNPALRARLQSFCVTSGLADDEIGIEHDGGHQADAAADLANPIVAAQSSPRR